MHLSDLIVVSASFLASAVEMVEALTIVLAVGVTRGWRSTRIGVAAAIAALALVVLALGPALRLLPIGTLRLVVGSLLLIFGMQWLRKAILRASGVLPLHDEDAAYRLGVAAARSAGAVVREGMDWYAFTLSFKGVFLEGLEVAFIVLTFGASQGHRYGLTAAGAAAAVLAVTGVGVLVHQPLSQVPENTMKFAVGAMLSTFGIFWAGEGVGVDWPGSDVAILGILVFITLWSLALVGWLSRYRRESPALR
jgi:uncharacterized membrane protein